MYFSNFLADARNIGIRNRNRWMRKWSNTAGRGMEQIFSGAYDDKGKKLK